MNMAMNVKKRTCGVDCRETALQMELMPDGKTGDYLLKLNLQI